MPIYQHRVIRLVEAGESFIGFRDRCSNVIHLVTAGRMLPQDAISTIAEYIAGIDEFAEHVIKDERSRFNVTARRNDVERERMRARRAGIPFIPPMAESLVSKSNRLAAAHEMGGVRRKTVRRADSDVEPMSQERLDRLNDDTDDTLDLGSPNAFQQYEDKLFGNQSDAERRLFDKLAEENRRRHEEES